MSDDFDQRRRREISYSEDLITKGLLDLVPGETLKAFLQTFPELQGKNVNVALRGSGFRNSAADPSVPGIPLGAEVTWQLGSSSPIEVVYDYRFRWDTASYSLTRLSCCSRHHLHEGHDSEDLQQRLVSLGVLREVSLGIDAEVASYESLDPRQRAEYDLSAVPLRQSGHLLEVGIDDLSVLRYLEQLVGMPSNLIFLPVILSDRQVLEHYAHKSHGGLVGEETHLMAHTLRLAQMEAGQNAIEALEAGTKGLVEVDALQWRVGGRACGEAPLRFHVKHGGGLSYPLEVAVSEQVVKVEYKRGRFLGVTQPEAWSSLLGSAADHRVWHPTSDQWSLGPGARE